MGFSVELGLNHIPGLWTVACECNEAVVISENTSDKLILMYSTPHPIIVN